MRLNMFDRTCGLDHERYYKKHEIMGYYGSANARLYPLYGKHLNFKIEFIDLNRPEDVPSRLRQSKCGSIYMVDVDGAWLAVLQKMIDNNELRQSGDNKYALPR